MKKTIFLFLILIVCASNFFTQTIAQKRAAMMGRGMNFTYLDNWWRGTKEKKYSDFVNLEDAMKREKTFADIAKSGFKTVRIPITFGAWANYEKPYKWENAEAIKSADSFVKWASENNLNAIVDLHHVEFDGSVKNASKTERLVWLWTQIAERYKNTNPDKVFFEIRNEPHDVNASEWRNQAEAIIKVIRSVAPNHTLIVGFHDWNSRDALLESKPFKDSNIIYTFHYYHPFLFTHQGATWSSEGLPEAKNIPFPADEKTKLIVPETAKGKWTENLFKSYPKEAKAEWIYRELKQAKDWSEKNKVPIFVGEFGSFNKFAALDDRCRHAEAVYSALGKLDIPNAWWEWDQGFTMFKPGTNEISDCMQKAIDAFDAN